MIGEENENENKSLKGGKENELENEKHWMWPLLKKMYKESYEEPFFNMLESKSFSLYDGTRIKIKEN